MCGIFGVIAGTKSKLTVPVVDSLIKDLFRLSDSRGKEASGWAVRTDLAVTVYKQPSSGRQLSRLPEARQRFLAAITGLPESEVVRMNGQATLRMPLAIVGHSRLVTNGKQTCNENNQPVIRDGLVGIHNGIVVNVDELWRTAAAAPRQSEVDTEIILHLLHRHLQAGLTSRKALARMFTQISGTASIALLAQQRSEVLLASNNGSLYIASNGTDSPVFFASERYIMEQLLQGVGRAYGKVDSVRQVRPMEGCVVTLDPFKVEMFTLNDGETATRNDEQTAAPASVGPGIPASSPGVPLRIFPREAVFDPSKIRRCTRCILPETFPGITFDADGVCDVCKNYVPMKILGREALDKAVAPFRRKDGGADCLVAFSGGRDSSYGLHYLKKELGLNPIAFTYDWGMVTDLARRNQARMCGKLGIEHILISADIASKRRNVRRNIEAWLRKPELGMIPLFMAGDKQFFYYANMLMKQTHTPVMIFSVNPLEKTGFKTGFCGVHDKASGMYFNFSMGRKLRITSYYAKQYLTNPRYLNSSLPDTLWAYASSFLISHDYLMLFDYIRWEEDVIEKTLLEEYDWETAPDTKSTWRIGDGTAAFYNHIYYTVTGFTENDTFRSNQVREGALTRAQALAKVQEENQPRWESMQWYAKTIGFDLEEALAVINSIPRLYHD